MDVVQPKGERVWVLVPAAGLGRRMGGSIPKPYLCLNGEPVLLRTLALFQSHPLVDAIVVVAAADQLAECQELIDMAPLDKVVQVVAGGAERQDSVRHGLLAMPADEQDVVLIHDGVRPLFPAEGISEVVARARQIGACVVGVPVKDTMKEVENGYIVATPPRQKLWAAQTPQAFRYGLIREAHLLAAAKGYAGTDDASLVEWLGHPVEMIAGDYRNLKLTTPEDVLIAQALLHGSSQIHD